MGHVGAGSRALSHTRNQSHSEQLRVWPQKLSQYDADGFAFLWLQASHLQTENLLDIHSVPGQHWGEGGIDTTSQTPRKEGTLFTQWHQLTHTGSDPGSGKDSGVGRSAEYSRKKVEDPCFKLFLCPC